MVYVDAIFILGMFAVVIGSFILSIQPWVDLYIKKGYAKRDAYKIVIKNIWKL